MKRISINKAKTHLSSIVDKAAKEEAFIITKAEKPMVKVIPCAESKKTSRIGFLKDQISIPEDLDRMCEAEIAEIFG